MAVAVALSALLAATGAAGAAPARAREVVEMHAVYADAAGHPLSLVGYLPRERAAPVPSVLVVHGGGWSGGGLDGSAQVASAIARAGMAAFVVGYRLDRPHHPGFPSQVGELEEAARWVAARADLLGLAPGRLGALGSSAGGNLAALLALAPGAPRLSAVVTWSAPLELADFGPLMRRSCTRGGCGRNWLASDLLDYVGCMPAACPRRWAGASPVDEARPSGAAWLLFNSSHELVPLAGAKRMVSRLEMAGAQARLVVYPGARHAGEYAGSAIGPSIDFLLENLAGQSTPGAATR